MFLLLFFFVGFYCLVGWVFWFGLIWFVCILKKFVLCLIFLNCQNIDLGRYFMKEAGAALVSH